MVSKTRARDRSNRYDPSGRPPTIWCKACSKCTYGGKPMCTDHIGKMPIVDRINREMRKSEKDRVKKKPDPHGLVSRDILCSLIDHQLQMLTVGKLTRCIKMGDKPTMNHVAVLASKGYVKIVKDAVVLTEAGALSLFSDTPRHRSYGSVKKLTLKSAAKNLAI